MAETSENPDNSNMQDAIPVKRHPLYRYRFLAGGMAVLFLLTLVATALLATGTVRIRNADTLSGGVVEEPFEAPDFTLTSAAGPVALSDYRGKVVQLFFGYSNCPDVCPMTLNTAAETSRRLGDDASRFTVLFVSVDPERDTPQVAHQYAQKFSPSFTGVSGTADEVLQVAKQWGIQFERTKAADPSGFFFVNHSAYSVMIDPNGMVRELVLPEMDAGDIASDVRLMLRQ